MSKRPKKGGARNNRHAQGGSFVAADAPDLETILRSEKNPFLLVLDGVQDPHNLEPAFAQQTELECMR